MYGTITGEGEGFLSWLFDGIGGNSTVEEIAERD
jgi:hypothetical protein